ncbi:MAG: zeta toxin family protein [Methylacidiphilales bacterium]|nr:zeta toxin family protein [Candidatus Methylacidiphilales bacterium]
MSPVLEALKAGDKFPFPLLLSHTEDCLEFWEWWWAQVSLDELTRPYLIQDDDPVLGSTLDTMFIDTLTYFDYFDKFLRSALKDRLLPQGDHIARNTYRDELVQLMSRRGVANTERRIIFAGGGYGAGKSTTLSKFATGRNCPLSVRNIVGVDSFKLFLPEYEVVRRLGDGRASTIVQKEARMLANKLFERLVQMGRSFIWDSSMSDFEATMEHIQEAKARGYTLELVAVASPIQAAIRRAMYRAKETRRFAHPDFLLSSHRDFASYFEAYFPHFQKVMLFWNAWEARPEQAIDPLLIAENNANNELVSYDQGKLEQFLQLKL